MPEGLYLAYLPQDQKWLVTGGYDLFILNHTPWEVIFNLYLERDGGKYVGKDYDVIPARHRIHLASIKADKLESWTAGTLQFLFRKDKTDRILSPVSVDFRIKAYRFLKEGSYLEYAFMEGRSFLLSLMPLTAVGTSGKRAAGGKAEPPVVVKTEEEAELIHSFRTGPLEAEVDLHIGSLVEAANGLSKHEMLTIQAGHFLACLESGLRAGYRKIIFIHGIGAGRLREEITQRLREYDGLSWEDAPMRDYGQGAILVRLPGKGQ